MSAPEKRALDPLPDSLRSFLEKSCGLPAKAFRSVTAPDLPESARHLLAHDRDMTSTLSRHHGGSLRVDILRQETRDETYLREVYLRLQPGDTVVEYGVIAISWKLFTEQQREAIGRGSGPLGGLLHEFRVPFTCSPAAFFAVAANLIPRLSTGRREDAECYGRYARLATPAGAILAWVVEILPLAPATLCLP
jgi:hypothetical protein